MLIENKKRRNRKMQKKDFEAYLSRRKSLENIDADFAMITKKEKIEKEEREEDKNDFETHLGWQSKIFGEYRCWFCNNYKDERKMRKKN